MHLSRHWLAMGRSARRGLVVLMILLVLLVLFLDRRDQIIAAGRPQDARIRKMSSVSKKKHRAPHELQSALQYLKTSSNIVRD